MQEKKKNRRTSRPVFRVAFLYAGSVREAVGVWAESGNSTGFGKTSAGMRVCFDKIGRFGMVQYEKSLSVSGRVKKRRTRPTDGRKHTKRKRKKDDKENGHPEK